MFYKTIQTLRTSRGQYFQKKGLPQRSPVSLLFLILTGMSLYHPGDQYALKMRLVDHVYDDQVIDFLTVKIILPEGARSVL